MCDGTNFETVRNQTRRVWGRACVATDAWIERCKPKATTGTNQNEFTQGVFPEKVYDFTYKLFQLYTHCLSLAREFKIGNYRSIRRC